MRTGETYYVHDVTDGAFDPARARAQMEDEGFIVLRNAASAETVRALTDRASQILTRPALGGSWGYYRKDIFKKMYDAFLLGRPAIDVVLNPFVIDFVQSYMGGKLILAEAFLKHDEGMNHLYFPLHSDFAIGWTQPLTDVVLKREDFDKVIAVGAMMYLSDTTEGAFLFAPGSHRSRSFDHAELSKMPADIRAAVKQSLLRIEGKAGDIVLFNDLGIHGPEQPVTTQRTVLIYDYYNCDVFGERTKSGMPAYINDLAGLSQEQLRILGLGADIMIPTDAYHVRGFDRHASYRLMRKVYEGLFGTYKAQFRAKQRIKRLLGRAG